MFYRCPQCHELFAADTLPLARCGSCGAVLQVTPPTAEPLKMTTKPDVEQAPRTEAERVALAAAWAVPWEKADATAAHRFFGTLRQLLRSAPRFFFHLEESDSGRAEGFAYLVSLIGIAGYFASQVFFLGQGNVELSQAIADWMGNDAPAPAPEKVSQIFLYGLYLSPLLAYLPAHIATGLYQAGLFVVGAPSRGYNVTFRIAAYGMAPIMLCALPGLGILIAPGWILALHWIGLAAGHRMSLATAALAVVLPWLMFTLFAGGLLGRMLLFWLYGSTVLPGAT